MSHNLYSVLDKKAGVFTMPFHQLNDEVAIRTMTDCVNTQNHNYQLNPDDYALYLIGEFEDTTGFINPDKNEDGRYPEKLCDLSELPQTGRGAQHIDTEKIERDFELMSTEIRKLKELAQIRKQSWLQTFIKPFRSK